MFELKNQIRPELLNFKPYTSARHLTEKGRVLLDANENPFDNFIDIGAVVANRYPDPTSATLRAALSDYVDVPANNIFAGSGSDEIIDLLLRLFCTPNQDEVVIIEPTYGMYKVSSELNGIRTKSCLLGDDFDIDISKLEEAVSEKTKLVFCCSPNNPTGNILSTDKLLEYTRDKGLILVVDEAYIEFSSFSSLTRKAEEFPNLIVLRTLSKAWGLAGIRLGYCVAGEQIIEYLMRIKLPYNVNVLTEKVALLVLDDRIAMENAVSDILSERERIRIEFDRSDIFKKVFPSEANFLLVLCEDASKIQNYLADKSIIVRNRSSDPLLDNCLRITVGSKAQNDLLLEALRRMPV